MATKTITARRPITLHGLCHVPDSFCDGIELCTIPYQKLVPEKSGTRLTDTRACFWYQTTGTSFCDVCRRLKGWEGIQKGIQRRAWLNLNAHQSN